MNIKNIDDACAMYNAGTISNLELSYTLIGAGIPESLVRLVGTMHCDNVQMKVELRRLQKKGFVYDLMRWATGHKKT